MYRAIWRAIPAVLLVVFLAVCRLAHRRHARLL
jgi:hypothetical protein